MGLIFNHKLEDNGKYSVSIQGLNISQAMEIMGKIEKWEEERMDSPFGSINLVPAGAYKGNTIEDISNEQGLAPLVQMAQSYPRFGESEVLKGASPYDAISFYQELIPWLLINISEYDTLIIVEAFRDIIPDADGIRKRIETTEGREEGWSIELERSKLIDCIYNKLTDLVSLVSEDFRVLNMEYADGESAVSLKDIFFKNGYSGIVQQMLREKKGTVGFDKCRAHLACIVMFAKNLIPYDEFLKCFGVFFKINAETYEHLMSASEEEKKKDYDEKSRSLISRIINAS